MRVVDAVAEWFDLHVDIDPAEIGRNYPVELGIVSDARSVYADLQAAGPTARRGLPKSQATETSGACA